MCTFGLSGCCVKPRRPQIKPGFTRQPEFRPRRYKQQNSTGRHSERHKQSETVAGKGKTSAKLWAPPFGAPPFGCLFFQALFFHLVVRFFFFDKEDQKTETLKLAKVGLGKVGQLRLAKVGLAKVGQIRVAKVGQLFFWPKSVWPKSASAVVSCLLQKQHSCFWKRSILLSNSAFVGPRCCFHHKIILEVNLKTFQMRQFWRWSPVLQAAS